MGLFALIVLMAGCATPPAPREWYVVMPEPDGRVGTVVVTTHEGKQTMLHGAYASARSDGGPVVTANEQEVRKTFAKALQATPIRPALFVVFFAEGRDDLAREGLAELASVIHEIGRRPAPELTITGHADATRSHAYNDALSARRAERVRATLVRLGADPRIITMGAQGKRTPLVRTQDNVAERRNRRVEVEVR